MLIYYNIFHIMFIIGLIGLIINRKNIIRILISIELMLLAINLLFLTSSIHMDDWIGQGFSLWILTIAAAESAIGLAILICYYRVKGTISISFNNLI